MYKGSSVHQIQHLMEVLRDTAISLLGYKDKSLNTDLWRFVCLHMEVEKSFNRVLINSKVDCQFKNKAGRSSHIHSPYFELKKNRSFFAPYKNRLPALDKIRLRPYVQFFKLVSDLMALDKQIRSDFIMEGLVVHPIVVLLNQKKWSSSLYAIRKKIVGESAISGKLNLLRGEISVHLCEEKRTALHIEMRQLQFAQGLIYKKLELEVFESLVALRNIDLERTSNQGILASRKVYDRTVQNRENSTALFMKNLLAQHHSLKAIRFELGYTEKLDAKINLNDVLTLAKSDIADFLIQLKKKKHYECLRGYIHKHEYCFHAGHRHHFIFFFDHSFDSDAAPIVADMGELWQKTVDQGRGTYAHCLDETGYRFAHIGEINEHDHLQHQNLSNALEYLKYSDYYFKLNVKKRLHVVLINRKSRLMKS